MKVIDNGMFSEKCDAYGIKITGSDDIIYRRYIDFKDLSDLLERLYPGYIVPNFPSKVIEELDKKSMKSRKGKLQIFLDKLLKHPLFPHTDFVWNFLTMRDPAEYETIKNTMKEIANPDKIYHFTTLEGETNVYLDNSLKQSCNEIVLAKSKIKEELDKYF